MFVAQTRNSPFAAALAFATSASIDALPTIRPALPAGKYGVAEPNVNS